MGAYLSSPALEKISQDFEENGQYSCGLSGMQGWRISMEDAHNCIPDIGDGTSLFAVYDGHGGGEVAIYCSLHFADMLKKTSDYKSGKLEEALSQTFMDIDRKIKEPAAKRELKVLSQKDPGDPAPNEEDYKKMEDEEKEDEDETKLLYEEATMNIDDLLARYGRVANETKEMIKSIKGEESSRGSETEKPKQTADQTSPPSSKEATPIDTGSKKETVDSSTKEETDTKKNEKTTAKTAENAGGDAKLTKQEKSDETTADSKTTVETKKVLKKTFVKVKPTKAVDDDAESEDDDYDGFESDEAMGGSSSEEESEEEEDDEEEDEMEEGEEEEPDDEHNDEKDGATTLSELEALGSGTDEPGSDSGTTAVVALLRENSLHVANAGDSRCVLCRKDGKAFDMSDDHKPEDERELTRIRAAGGHVNPQGRVNGGLNLSRAIGDHCYKTNKNLSLEEQMISALPDIRSVTLMPGDEFMVLACDGIWNVMSSQEVVDFVRERLKPNEDQSVENGNAEKDKKTKLSKICEEIFTKCLAPNTEGDGTGCDNMTCIIIQFDQDWLKRVAKTTDTTEDVSDVCENQQTLSEGAARVNNHSTNELNTDIDLVKLHKHSEDVVTECDMAANKRNRTDDSTTCMNGNSDNQPKRIKIE